MAIGQMHCKMSGVTDRSGYRRKMEARDDGKNLSTPEGVCQLKELSPFRDSAIFKHYGFLSSLEVSSLKKLTFFFSCHLKLCHRVSYRNFDTFFLIVFLYICV